MLVGGYQSGGKISSLVSDLKVSEYKVCVGTLEEMTVPRSLHSVGRLDGLPTALLGATTGTNPSMTLEKFEGIRKCITYTH